MKQLATIFIVLTLLICASCGTGLKISESYCKPIDDKFSGTFLNQSFKSTDENSNITLLQLFNIDDSKTDSITLKFDNIRQLQIIFYDSLSIMEYKIRKETFQGNFSKKGYFEIYLSNVRKEIPPLLPIFFYNYDIDRIRISFTTSNELIVDNKWNRAAYVIGMAAGDSDRTQYFFKKTNVPK